MKRDELLKKWCALEGGKVEALNWPQAKEAWASLRRIIGNERGIDIDDILEGRSIYLDMGELAPKHHLAVYEAFPLYAWSDGKPVKKRVCGDRKKCTS